MKELAIGKNVKIDTSTIDSEQQGQYLTFLVAKDKLAIAISDVNEIIEISNITHVPMTPDYIRGVINLRDNVVPVIDLSSRLNDNLSELTKHSCIILVEIKTDDEIKNIGLLVDQVDEILEIPEQNIQAAPEFGTEIKTDFIQAMGRVGDEFIILLDINRVLSVKALASLSNIASSTTDNSQSADEE